MATIKNFEELKVWQKSRKLCHEIYRIITSDKFSRDFALKDLVNRSSGSIMDNIAEGFGRNGNIEFINFLSYSNGSAFECKSQLYRAFDRNYISQEKQAELFNLIDEVTKMISSLTNYLGGTDFRGVKFKVRVNSKTRN